MTEGSATRFNFQSVRSNRRCLSNPIATVERTVCYRAATTFSKWAIAQQRHAFDSTMLPAMVRYRIVLGAPVIPLGDAVLSPPETALDFRSFCLANK